MEQFVHGGNIYETKPVTGEWLDFSANVNMLGLAPAVRAAVAAGFDKVVHYPDPEARELKQAISQHYNLPVEQIVLGNGAAELFYLFFQTIRPRRVLLPVPSFSEYERAALAARCRVNYFELAEDRIFVWTGMISWGHCRCQTALSSAIRTIRRAPLSHAMNWCICSMS